MIPGKLDLTLYRGDDFSLIFRMRDTVSGAYIDLTERAGRAEIRPEAVSDTILAAFTVTILDQTAVPGGVSLTLTPAQTAALPLSGGVWDVELFDVDGTTGAPIRSWVRTPLAGKVTVLAEVTR